MDEISTVTSIFLVSNNSMELMIMFFNQIGNRKSKMAAAELISEVLSTSSQSMVK
jgi:hypothetical protein